MHFKVVFLLICRQPIGKTLPSLWFDNENNVVGPIGISLYPSTAF
jgi:hypothetical protein